MKNYKNLVKTLPKKTIVFTFGRFNPYSIGHNLLVNRVKQLAEVENSDHLVV